MTDDLDIEVPQDAKGFASELRRLADALEAGRAHTIDLDGTLVTIPAEAVFSVSHESEDGEAELEFQIAWSAMSDGADEDEEDEDEEDEDEEDDGVAKSA
jgi:amphi-Trp domain-containing protein